MLSSFHPNFCFSILRQQQAMGVFLVCVLVFLDIMLDIGDLCPVEDIGKQSWCRDDGVVEAMWCSIM